jgi:hypothetical protein
MYLSTYTSLISAIELYWSALKNRIQAFMTKENINVTLDRLQEETYNLLSTIQPGDYINESWRKAGLLFFENKLI